MITYPQTDDATWPHTLRQTKQCSHILSDRQRNTATCSQTDAAAWPHTLGQTAQCGHMLSVSDAAWPHTLTQTVQPCLTTPL